MELYILEIFAVLAIIKVYTATFVVELFDMHLCLPQLFSKQNLPKVFRHKFMCLCGEFPTYPYSVANNLTKHYLAKKET